MSGKKKKGPDYSCEQGRVTIRCNDCDGMSDISDNKCLICVCDYVRVLGEVNSILLRSGSDVSYQGEIIPYIRELASVYGLMRRDPSHRRGSRCKKCKNSYSVVMCDQISEFPDLNVNIPITRLENSDVNNDVCRVCIEDSIRLFEHIGVVLDDIHSRLNKDYAEVD